MCTSAAISFSMALPYRNCAGEAEEIPGFYEAYMFGEFMPFALPIGADGCGNLYFFDKRKNDNAVYLVDAGNMDWDGDGFELLAESFSECVNGNFKDI